MTYIKPATLSVILSFPGINDPEHPLNLEELKVLENSHVEVNRNKTREPIH